MLRRLRCRVFAVSYVVNASAHADFVTQRLFDRAGVTIA
jgi:hypothetical protein